MRQPPFLRVAALAVLLLIVILVPVSAWLRHAEIPPSALLVAEPGSLGALMRQVHRLVASSLLILVLAVNLAAWMGGGSDRILLRRPAAMLLAITLALALLGIMAGGSKHPAVVAGHLFGGLLAAVTAAWLALVATAPDNGARPPVPAVAAMAWTALIAVVLGGLPGPADWSLPMTLHIAAAIILAGLCGRALIRTAGREGWPALLLLAAVGASGWWAGWAGAGAIAATAHTAIVVLLLLELTRLRFRAYGAAD